MEAPSLVPVFLADATGEVTGHFAAEDLSWSQLRSAIAAAKRVPRSLIVLLPLDPDSGAEYWACGEAAGADEDDIVVERQRGTAAAPIANVPIISPEQVATCRDEVEEPGGDEHAGRRALQSPTPGSTSSSWAAFCRAHPSPALAHFRCVVKRPYNEEARVSKLLEPILTAKDLLHPSAAKTLHQISKERGLLLHLAEFAYANSDWPRLHPSFVNNLIRIPVPLMVLHPMGLAFLAYSDPPLLDLAKQLLPLVCVREVSTSKCGGRQTPSAAHLPHPTTTTRRQSYTEAYADPAGGTVEKKADDSGPVLIPSHERFAPTLLSALLTTRVFNVLNINLGSMEDDDPPVIVVRTPQRDDQLKLHQSGSPWEPVGVFFEGLAVAPPIELWGMAVTYGIYANAAIEQGDADPFREPPAGTARRAEEELRESASNTSGITCGAELCEEPNKSAAGEVQQCLPQYWESEVFRKCVERVVAECDPGVLNYVEVSYYDRYTLDTAKRHDGPPRGTLAALFELPELHEAAQVALARTFPDEEGAGHVLDVRTLFVPDAFAVWSPFCATLCLSESSCDAGRRAKYRGLLAAMLRFLRSQGPAQCGTEEGGDGKQERAADAEKETARMVERGNKPQGGSEASYCWAEGMAARAHEAHQNVIARFVDEFGTELMKAFVRERTARTHDGKDDVLGPAQWSTCGGCLTELILSPNHSVASLELGVRAWFASRGLCQLVFEDTKKRGRTEELLRTSFWQIATFDLWEAVKHYF